MRLMLPLAFVAAGTSSAAYIDCERAEYVASDLALQETCKLLLRNYEKFDVIYGPRHFDNHLSYFVIALYRMGASAQRIREAYAYETQNLEPAIPSQHLVNASSWQAYMRQGKYYKDYFEFIDREVHSHGLRTMMRVYAPVALQGLTGGLLHPLIQLGYGFELMDTNAISQGVAWLFSHGEIFPKLNPRPAYSFKDAETILGSMRADARLPNRSITLEALQSEYAEVLSDYDIALPEGDTIVQVPVLFEALAARIFGTTCNNFFLLHLCTGSRAMSRIMLHVEDPLVRSAALQQLWKGFVYVYALEGRPMIGPPRVGPLRPWEHLVKAALPIQDVHLQKMVYLCRENYRLDRDTLWWSVAEGVVTLFENGGSWVFSSFTPAEALWPPDASARALLVG